MGHRSRRSRPEQFVQVPNQTVDYFECRSPIALALLTIQLRHADGYPITVSRVKDNAQHGTRKQYGEAYNMLLDDGYAVYLQYNVQDYVAGEAKGRPSFESMTLWADTPHSPTELQDILDEHRPGKKLTLMDSPQSWRRVRIVSSKVRYWDGTKTINNEGKLEEPKQAARKPGYASGTKTRHEQQRGSDGKFGRHAK